MKIEEAILIVCGAADTSCSHSLGYDDDVCEAIWELSKEYNISLDEYTCKTYENVMAWAEKMDYVGKGASV